MDDSILFHYFEMDKLVNVHYLDKATFMNGNADEGEEAMVFDTSPSYDDIVVKVRIVLNWINLSDGVKLIGRYDVGMWLKPRLKSTSWPVAPNGAETR